tara:strand:- start:7213 stop:8919 length:1707 start_codon:yes stop_codon:yes gene_type:complete
MELQRTRVFLLLSLFVVGMLLYTNWQQQFAPSTSTVAQEEPTKTVPQYNDIPSDLVSASSPNDYAHQNLASTSADSAASTGTLISVKTDVLDLRIDTKGGDIVFAQLPQYPKSLETPEDGYQLLQSSGDGYYIVQTGLVGRDQKGPDSKKTGRGQLQYAKTNYQLSDNQDVLEVPLVWDKDGIEVTKTFTFKRGEYLSTIRYDVKNKTSEPWVGSFYGQIKRKKQEKKNGLMGVQMYQGGAVYTEDKPYKKISFGDMKDSNFNQKIQGGWAAMLERYFLSAWIPDSQDYNKYYTSADENNVFGIGSISSFEVLPGEHKEISGQLYTGPEVADELKQISSGLELTVDYGILWPISQLLFWLLKHIYGFLGNWGWSIISLTLLIKIVFYKLSAKSYTSMAHMKAVQPKIEALKQRCGEDKQQFSQGLLALYKKEKVNPLGGCLPILVQIPVFIALYYVLLESVELRQSPFIFWIQDLSIKDPFYILPLIMGASMFLQQRMNPPPPDPMQAKIMMAMPIVFTFLFLSFPSGLVLYWVSNNILSMLQQGYIQRKFGLNKNKQKNKPNIQKSD